MRRRLFTCMAVSIAAALILAACGADDEPAAVEDPAPAETPDPGAEQGVIDAVIVAISSDKEAWYLLGSPDIATPEDLAGARFSAGRPGDSWNIVSRIIMTDHWGIDPDELEWLSVPSSDGRLDAMLAGELDAFNGQPRHVPGVEEAGGRQDPRADPVISQEAECRQRFGAMLTCTATTRSTSRRSGARAPRHECQSHGQRVRAAGVRWEASGGRERRRNPGNSHANGQVVDRFTPTMRSGCGHLRRDPGHGDDGYEPARSDRRDEGGHPWSGR